MKQGCYDVRRLKPVLKEFFFILVTLTLSAPSWGVSYYPIRLDDPKAVYLTPDKFPVHADGVRDDTDAVQHAIDKVQETTGQGVVFIPEGHYRLTRTIYIWPGIRVIGYGARRPVLVLAANTPGYQDSNKEQLMVFFAGGRPGSGPGGSDSRQNTGTGRPPDANPGTFYSAVSNVDFEIGDGNSGAVAVRAHYAQHCFLAHIDFHIASGLAAIHAGGNVVEDVHFYGGRYAIWTATPSPGWQFTIVDATFEGQREAAIQERAAGLTLIRPQFKNVPTAIAIESGFPDDLWVKDARLEDISGPAVFISLENSPRTEINMENVACRRVPIFASFRESGKNVVGPGAIYNVKVFSHGLTFANIGAIPQIADTFEATPLDALPAPVKSDLSELPPADSWVNIRSLGAKGDGSSDDTEVLRKAIAEHRAIYFPAGNYVVSDTIALKKDTVLIGLHPSATEIDLLDSTPGFQGVGPPKPLIEAPRGGTNIMIGIGLYTNGINPRAVAAKWMAGKDSLMNDIRFLGGHGTRKLDGTRENPYNNDHTADPDLKRRWDGQYPSLWVTDGGGGTFLDIWTPSTFAQGGMLISNTSTEGRIYELSSEHHVRNEVQLHNVSNWRIYALQTEEERGESGFALPLEIEGSNNITISNFHIYRVVSSFQPFPWAIKVSNSSDVRFRNIHCYSNSKVAFDNAIYDQTRNIEVRQREFAWLNLSSDAAAPAVKASSIVPAPGSVLAPGAKVEKLSGGFYNISGGATDPAGNFYFVDARWQRIYRWSPADHQLSLVRDNPLDPTNLAFDRAGNLMVLSSAGAGTIYSLKPESSDDEIKMVNPEPVMPRPGLRVILPTNSWQVTTSGLAAPYRHYLSPDGSTFVSASEDFVTGFTRWNVKDSALLRSYGLASAMPGEPFYVTDEADVSTWVGTVQPDGSLAAMKRFVDQGGEGIAMDSQGNVYIAAGQIYVYSPAGELIDTVEVPERPIQLAFGGSDGHTLFIPARTSLYAVRTRFRGRKE
jgi:sugar lactone lactonase YvrE